MNHNHLSKYRNQDEYVCPACGKSWDVADQDVPECITEKQLGMQQRRGRVAGHANFNRRKTT